VPFSWISYHCHFCRVPHERILQSLQAVHIPPRYSLLIFRILVKLSVKVTKALLPDYSVSRKGQIPSKLKKRWFFWGFRQDNGLKKISLSS
jgi:hypothetical protein